MKKGRKLAESYGYKVTYFVGGNIRYAGGEFRGVVDTKKKTLYIVTAFIGEKGYKNGDTLSFDDKIPEATPKSATASSPTTNIPTANKNVNEKFSREPERLNELRRQNEELKQREYALTLKKSEQAIQGLLRPGTPDGIRTHDLQSRSLTLYPAELRAHLRFSIIANTAAAVKS